MGPVVNHASGHAVADAPREERLGLLAQSSGIATHCTERHVAGRLHAGRSCKAGVRHMRLGPHSSLGRQAVEEGARSSAQRTVGHVVGQVFEPIDPTTGLPTIDVIPATAGPHQNRHPSPPKSGITFPPRDLNQLGVLGVKDQHPRTKGPHVAWIKDVLSRLQLGL